jgi:hypothetical protein
MVVNPCTIHEEEYYLKEKMWSNTLSYYKS